MPTILETESCAYVQPKGGKGELDVYRIDRKGQIQSHETFAGLKDAEIVLQERTRSALSNVHESEIYLSVNAVTAAILFIEALRLRSKLLVAASLVSDASVVYANKRRKTHNEEFKWLEKEVIALENYSDGFLSVLR